MRRHVIGILLATAASVALGQAPAGPHNTQLPQGCEWGECLHWGFLCDDERYPATPACPLPFPMPAMFSGKPDVYAGGTVGQQLGPFWQFIPADIRSILQGSVPGSDPKPFADAIAASASWAVNQTMTQFQWYRLLQAWTCSPPQLIPNNVGICAVLLPVDTTTPPVASFLMTNLTAQAQNRVGTNYYGDRWRMQDTTSTGAPLTGVEWQLIAPDLLTTSITPNPVPWSYTGGAPVPAPVSTLDNGGLGIIWPCDPLVAGNPSTGAACFSSLGTATTGPSFVYDIKDRATNPNPPPSIAANSQTVQKPTVYVNGQTGNPAPLPIQVLSGAGVLNALGSPSTQGNTSESIFSWGFTCSGSPPCPAQSAVGLTEINPVNSNITAFTLDVTYKDGYTAPTVSGTIVQKDLIVNPGFSLSPSTVLAGGQITLTNLMQKSPAATVTSVTYTITQGAATVVSPTPLPSSFWTVYPTQGTTQITAPGTLGVYTISLRYNYDGPVDGSGQFQAPPDRSFTTTNWAPTPTLGVYADATAATNAICPYQFGCNLYVNTTYHLKDVETVPGDVTHPGAQFYFNSGSGFPVQPFASTTPPNGQTTVAFTPTQVCPSGCAFRLSVQGVNYDTAGANSLSITSSVQPLSASVSGPSNGSVNVPVTFSANVTGGVPPYSNYLWACEYANFTTYAPGVPTFPCTYSSANTYQVVVKVTDNAGTLAQSSPFSVIIGGGSGGLALTVSGPATAVRSTPVTFTATATGGSGGNTFAWTPGESPFDVPQSTGSSPSYTHTYTAASTYIVKCTVTSGSQTAQAQASIQITPPLGPPAPSAAYTVQNAASNPFNGTYDAEAGQPVTFSALEIPANVAANGYTWDFGDGSPRHGQQVTFAFAGTGARQVTLTVTGDGVNRAGTASSVIRFSVVAPSFQALLVPAAEHFFPDPGDTSKISATDVSVSNPGTTPVTISPMFLGFSATIPNNVFDLSTVAFDPSKKVTIPAGGTWSQVDVVKYLAGDVPNKGTLVFKYEGGDAAPLVTSRVYFAPATDPLGASAGSAFPSLKATRDGQVLPQGTQVAVEQSLPGLRGDASYDFRMSLFNSAGISGMFRISAVDQDGNTVTTLKDPRTGVPGSYVDFGIGPYQATDWSSDDLGLNDPAKRYVLKARKTPGFTTGRLLPLVTMRDRVTHDQVVVTSDGPPEYREPCAGNQNQNCVNYIVAGASRYPTPDGGRWKTSISIYNPSSQLRGVGLTYSYTTTDLLAPEKVASSFIPIPPYHLATVPGLNGVVCCDDVVSQLFATQDNHLADLLNGTFGVLRVQHYVDGETSTSPLLISARNYDDQPTGTYGSQLAVYTRPISVGPGETPLLLTGLEQDDSSNPKPRFAPTIVNIFAYDDVLTVVRLTALKNDGTELGHHIVALNNPGASGHFQPRYLDANDFTGNLNGIQNAPISVKIEVLQGGRVGAYALIQDITTRDPTYVQAAPQN